MADQCGTVIYKICSAQEWRSAVKDGRYVGAAVDLKDGFIHFSVAHQVQETAAKHFRGQADLVLIAFRADDFGDDLKWEASRGGDLFPHLYRTLETDHAIWQEALPLDEDGIPTIPERVSTC